LTDLDKLRGTEREVALERALGMTASDINEQSKGHVELSEDVLAIRELSEAIEAAVRGNDGALGLDWGD
jgi:zinc finger HIT domain-containing protein 3